MTTQTGSHSRTITGYFLHLLEYPRWLMECDTDFTHCPYHGRYDGSVADCDTCDSGKGCSWIYRYTENAVKTAPLIELVDALDSAVDYVAGRQPETHPRNCICDDCQWLRTTRQFLRSLPE